jgi:hypothetical protein
MPLGVYSIDYINAHSLVQLVSVVGGIWSGGGVVRGGARAQQCCSQSQEGGGSGIKKCVAFSFQLAN